MSYNAGYSKGGKDFKRYTKQNISVNLIKNPYRRGSIEYLGWYDGFNAAQRQGDYY